jgi:hypothetical protein
LWLWLKDHRGGETPSLKTPAPAVGVVNHRTAGNGQGATAVLQLNGQGLYGCLQCPCAVARMVIQSLSQSSTRSACAARSFVKPMYGPMKVPLALAR